MAQGWSFQVLYTLSNIKPQNLEYGSASYEKAVNSVYGLVNLGFKDMIFLDLTARNDWSSTLPESNSSYFYPSASLSVLFDEMFNMPSHISLVKLRGGVAQVGNDTDPYQLAQVLDPIEAWGGVTRLSKSGLILSPDLKSEKATSYEGGLDLNLFNNRVRFGATYYYLENVNQILSNQVPPSSGFTNLKFNSGLVVSKGLELTLGGTPIDKDGFRVDANMNFSHNSRSLRNWVEVRRSILLD